MSVLEFDTSRYSEVSLVEIDKDVIKDDDSAVLLEGGAAGGGLQSGNPRARTPSTAYSPIFRFMLMDEAFLIENRSTLRAICEFSALLAYFYLCDRTDFFSSSTKSYNRDLFIFLYVLLIIVSAMTSFTIHNENSPSSLAEDYVLAA